MNPSVTDKALQCKPGDLPSQWIERRQYNRFGRIIHHQVNPSRGFNGTDVSAFASDDLSFDLVTFQLEYGNSIFNGLLCCSTLDALDNDLPGFLVGLLACILNDLLLQGKRSGMGLLFEALNQLGLGIFCAETGDFFQLADMLFLVLFEFGSFLVDNLNLPVKVFLDGVVFLYLLFNCFKLLAGGLLLLLDPVFRVIDFLVLLQGISLVVCLELDKTLFCF